MYEQPRWPREALGSRSWAGSSGSGAPRASGSWASCSRWSPACCCWASGTSLLFWPGDDRITHFAALGGLLGVPLRVAGRSLSRASGSAHCSPASPRHRSSPRVSRRSARSPTHPAFRRPPWTCRRPPRSPIDEVLLSTMVLTRDSPWGRERERILRETQEARTLFASRGWLDKPADYHRNPPALDEVANEDRPHVSESTTRSGASRAATSPHEDEPCRDRWLSYERNRTAYARVLRSHRTKPALGSSASTATRWVGRSPMSEPSATSGANAT